MHGLTTGRKLKAAIVGLGNVGILFDEDPRRKASGEIWTHFSAYKRLERLYDLVAVVEPDIARIEKAKIRQPQVMCFPSVEEMLSRVQVDVVSICTPDALHLKCLELLVGHVKGIFLEKPLCSLSEINEAKRLTDEIKRTGTCIRVNYYKKTEPLFIKASDYMDLKDSIHVSARYSGPFDAVGCHSLNLLVSLVPNLESIRSFRFSQVEGDGLTALFQDNGKRLAELVYCGPRHKLIFELEILGKDGRVLLERNFSSLNIYKYRNSERYDGYEELEFVKNDQVPFNPERFIPFLKELAEEVVKSQPHYENLSEALRTQELMCQVSEGADV